jgi:hypothetical protein
LSGGGVRQGRGSGGGRRVEGGNGEERGGRADKWAATIVPGGGTGCQAHPSGTVPGDVNSNWIQNISNGFKFTPNFDRSKSCLPVLEKLEIKYGWKELEMGNNFA